MRKTILITAAFFAAAAAALPARAESPVRRETVSLAGLDLASPADRARLDRRIAAAVETVCGSYAGASQSEQREIDGCRAAARTGIETQLAALHGGRQLALGSRWSAPQSAPRAAPED